MGNKINSVVIDSSPLIYLGRMRELEILLTWCCMRKKKNFIQLDKKINFWEICGKLVIKQSV